MPSTRGGRYGFVYKSRHKAYNALRRKGLSKSYAARIANKGVTKSGRQQMSRRGKR